MTIFDKYNDNKGKFKISTTLLWDFDLSRFDFQECKNIVVARVIERGRLEDYFAAFDLYGGYKGFREIIKDVPYLSPRDISLICVLFNLKKEDLKCYTRTLSRQKQNRVDCGGRDVDSDDCRFGVGKFS